MNQILKKAASSRRALVLGATLLTSLTQALQAANYTSPTTGAQQAAGANWNALGYWQPGGLAITDIVATDPAATFELRPGARLRTPVDSTDSEFPGAVLTLDGNGVRFQNPAATDPVSEIRFKQYTGPEGGIVTFPRLVLNGGQLDTGNDGIVILRGQLDILKTAAFNNDGNNDRGFVIESFMTGSADAQVYLYNDAFHTGYVRSLNIAGNTNTFSGKWNVAKGVLLGTGTNSLGTNNITVGVDGALETTYNINSPTATLQLNGRMYLHQDDVFGSVTVGTTALAKGTYTFEELNAQFPNNFPATWTAKLGAIDVNGTPFETGSGSITVANDNTTPVTITTALPAITQVQANAPAKLSIAVSGPVTAATWYSNNVVVATGVNLSYTTPVLTTAADNAVYSVIVENTVNKATNSTTLQVVTTPLTITFPGSIQQAIPESWETPGEWSDGNPASVSAAANPQNIYEVLPGARLRSPDGATNATFPGSVLKMDGNSVWNLAPAANGPLAELRFKQGNTVDENGIATGYGYVTFPNLVLNGGQLDVGNDGTVVIAGRVDVAKKSSLSVNAAANRGYRIDAQLTGTNEIEVHLSSTAAFSDIEAHNLNIASTNNPFSGTWNIVTGTLLGTAPGALGTNDINIGVNGALMTTYDINNPKGSLNLQGRMYLTQNDTFRTVTIGTTRLAAGAYTYDQLVALYPDFFPGAWTPLIGAEEVLTPSGSITVLEDNFVPTITITSPAAGAAYPNQPTYFAIAPTNITLTADATIERGTITKVEYFEGATKIGEATAAPYSVTWNNVPAGPHTITAKVSAANGQSATSKARIIVGTPLVSVNFQAAATTTPEGYLPDIGDVYGDRGNGQTYGWDLDNTANARQRGSVNSPDIRYDTFNHMQKPQPAGSVWEIAVPNGTYLVTGASGDPDNSDSVFDVQAEGVTFISGTPSTDTSA
ncbi:MAG TPA: Ig-like domain-containing protein, partial [Verrucomicrobiae bacterium]|nr:Ig-like domain-containing protein [Verrucomicrobiae bacterium]